MDEAVADVGDAAKRGPAGCGADLGSTPASAGDFRGVAGGRTGIGGPVAADVAPGRDGLCFDFAMGILDGEDDYGMRMVAFDRLERNAVFSGARAIR